MNYLAHIFLSGNSPRIQVGNFIGDAVKGKAYDNYPPLIRKGILLHRAIDDYADHHPLVKQCVQLLKPDFGRYSPILIDIFFDYLLARNFKRYSRTGLRHYCLRFYGHLILNYKHLPPRFKEFVWHFILTHRLGKYATLKGIRETIDIMVYLKKLPVDPDHVISVLQENLAELEQLFLRFFPEAILFSQQELAQNTPLNRPV